MIEILFVVTITAAALLTGNEFAVGAFIHPALSRLEDGAQVLSVQTIGRTYGRVMLFWMGGVVVLCVATVLAFPFWYSKNWWFLVAAAIVYIAAVIFSLLGPVPINNQVVKWNADDLPENWRDLRRLWDNFHSIRIVILLIGFVCLAFGSILK